MADVMDLVITLRKEVPNEATAKALVAVVKQKLSDNPSVVVTSHTTTRHDVD